MTKDRFTLAICLVGIGVSVGAIAAGKEWGPALLATWTLAAFGFYRLAFPGKPRS